MKTWKSRIYQHFKMPPLIEDNKKGYVVYRFECRKCVMEFFRLNLY